MFVVCCRSVLTWVHSVSSRTGSTSWLNSKSSIWKATRSSARSACRLTAPSSRWEWPSTDQTERWSTPRYYNSEASYSDVYLCIGMRGKKIPDFQEIFVFPYFVILEILWFILMMHLFVWLFKGFNMTVINWFVMIYIYYTHTHHTAWMNCKRHHMYVYSVC